jgi:VIT1/CCC1 family predicted Fe2+/Mn2+ transporter
MMTAFGGDVTFASSLTSSPHFFGAMRPAIQTKCLARATSRLRSQALNAIRDDDASKAHLKLDIPRLKRRATLLNSAILFSTMSAIITSLLVIVAFVCAFYNMRHEYAVAVLFVVALGFFTVSLVYLAREARIALNELDHYS